MTGFILKYDGSFEGLLCCVFEAYHQKLQILDIQPLDCAADQLFAESLEVNTDVQKASRVLKALQKKTSSQGLLRIKWTFLSELPGMEIQLFRAIQYIFASEKPVDADYSEDSILYLAQTTKKVGREKHRMEAFVRFRLTRDGIYFALIEPDFNVLPIISRHFTSRYADQEWIIYDLKRGFGLHYDKNSTQFIQLDLPENVGISGAPSEYFANEEIAFQELWQAYFNNVNIKSRVNTRLHLQHVPRRYWKYLTEKSSFA